MEDHGADKGDLVGAEGNGFERLHKAI
jgi:hypothetical protein